jgi:hypothetical protein
MKLILIGTDHRLQQSVVQDPQTKQWLPRSGQRFRKLISYCIEKMGAGAILEDAHAKQELVAPTICSTIARERGLTWQHISVGDLGLSDGLFDPPIVEAKRLGVNTELLAGRYVLKIQRMREAFMYASIMECFQEHDCILAVVGQVHLGVLANQFDGKQIEVEALLFTPLLVDESQS